MFISREEKQLILDVLELLEKRMDMVIHRLEKLEGWSPVKASELPSQGTITVSSTDVKWGTKKDGTPRKKPGRKPAREVFNKGAKK